MTSHLWRTFCSKFKQLQYESFVFPMCRNMILFAADRQPSYSWKHLRSFVWSIDGSDRELSYQQSTLKYQPVSNQQFPFNLMKLTSARFWCVTCFMRKIKRLRSIQGSFAALLFSLIAFSDLFQWLPFKEAFIKVMKLSVSIPEADSVHLFHLQLYFFSQWDTRIKVYADYRWAGAFFSFLWSLADLL